MPLSTVNALSGTLALLGHVSLSRIGASGSQTPPAAWNANVNPLQFTPHSRSPYKTKQPSGTTVLARAKPEPGSQETYLLVVLQCS
jgi:hypothetical protein